MIITERNAVNYRARGALLQGVIHNRGMERLRTLRERLRWARQEAQLSQQALAALCGWKGRTGQSRISHYETGRTPAVDPKDLELIAAALQRRGVKIATPGWLQFGERAPQEPVQINLLHQVEQGERFYHIPLNRRFLEGGPGVDTVGNTAQGSIAFRKDYMDAEGLDATRLETWFVVGDSMEPVLRHGDLVIVNTAVTEIVNGDIYAFYDTHGGRRGGGRIKYVHEQRDGSLILVSENAAKHPPETVPASSRGDIQIAGVVELRSGRLRRSR